MAAGERHISWRQGDVLADETVKELGISYPEEGEDFLVVIISHDCDLAATDDKEPQVEAIVARRIPKLGGDSFAKTARRLHIEYMVEGVSVCLELTWKHRVFIEKKPLFKSAPRPEVSLVQQGKTILRRWLGARYDRAAFPEAFEDRLRRAGTRKAPFLSRVETILDEGAEHVRALLFDLDDGLDVERQEPDDRYRLGIYVLYDSSIDEAMAAAAAEKTAAQLETLFNEAFHHTPGGWTGIELIYCDPLSDGAITVVQAAALKQWRLEHMSLRDDPPQAMLGN